MSTLYKLASDLQSIERLLEESEGELTEEIEAELDSLDGSFEDKAVKVMRLIFDAKAMAGAIGEEQDRLARRKKATKNREQSLRDYLQGCMEISGQRKLKTPYATGSISAGRTKVEYSDIDKIPASYYVQPAPVLDKEAVKTALKNDEEVPGAGLVQGADIFTIRR